MKHIKAITANASMMFLEFKDKFVIYRGIYDKHTLKHSIRDDKSSKLFNAQSINTNYVGGWATQKTYTDYHGLGNGWNYVADGKGPLSLSAGEGFSYNCRWHEKDHDPIFNFEDEYFIYQFVYGNQRSKGHTDLVKYTKTLDTWLDAGTNWGSFIGIPVIHPDEDLSRTETIKYVKSMSTTLSFDTDNYKDRNDLKFQASFPTGVKQSLNLLSNKLEYCVVWGMMPNNRSCIYKWNKSHNVVYRYKYRNPDYPTNYDDYLPIYSNDPAIGVHNTNDIPFDNPIIFVSDAIIISENVEHYYVHYHYGVQNNEEAPYIKHYVDSDGETQEANMRTGSYSNNDDYGRYFGIWRMVVDHSKKEYYYEIITLNTTSYSEWDKWPELNTSGMVLNAHDSFKSFNANSELYMYMNTTYMCNNCEIVNVDGTDYILTFAHQSYNYVNKVIMCAFTISGNTATLVGQPFIKLYRESPANGTISMKKMDRLGLEWILSYNITSPNLQLLYRFEWHPTTGWEEYMITDNWNSNGMYIDELGRYWGNGFIRSNDASATTRGDLSICTDKDFIVDYILPPEVITNKGSAVDISQTIEVQFRNVIGAKLKERQFIVTILSDDKYVNNTTFSDGLIENTITTDIEGIVTFDIISKGRDKFKIDYQIVELTT